MKKGQPTVGVATPGLRGWYNEQTIGEQACRQSGFFPWLLLYFLHPVSVLSFFSNFPLRWTVSHTMRRHFSPWLLFGYGTYPWNRTGEAVFPSSIRFLSKVDLLTSSRWAEDPWGLPATILASDSIKDLFPVWGDEGRDISRISDALTWRLPVPTAYHAAYAYQRIKESHASEILAKSLSYLLKPFKFSFIKKTIIEIR